MPRQSIQFGEGAQPDERHAGANAPGRDTILGVIDITSGRDAGSPQTIAMVRAGARLAVSELARHALT